MDGEAVLGRIGLALVAAVQLDRLDDLVAEPPAVSEVHRPAGREPVLQAPALASVAAVLAFNPRAPPFI